jgi:hypothetical protein
MKLSLLYESPPQPGYYRTILKKQQDPGSPEILGLGAASTRDGAVQLPSRSGNQNTPLKKARHRRFFNAPSTNNSSTDKIGFPDQAWSNPGSTRPRPAGTVGGPPASKPQPKGC